MPPDPYVLLLAEALRSFSEGNTILEHLAARDPTNAQWQRDLANSHSNLSEVAKTKGDDARAEAEALACLAVLERMKERGMYIDPPLAQMRSQLAEQFASERFGNS